jgi:hypothetical protein
MMATKKSLSALVCNGVGINALVIRVYAAVAFFVCVMLIEAPLIGKAIHRNGLLADGTNAVLWSTSLLAVVSAGLGSCFGWDSAESGSSNETISFFKLLAKLPKYIYCWSVYVVNKFMQKLRVQHAFCGVRDYFANFTVGVVGHFIHFCN